MEVLRRFRLRGLRGSRRHSLLDEANYVVVHVTLWPETMSSALFPQGHSKPPIRLWPALPNRSVQESVRSLIEDGLFPFFGNKLLEMSYDLVPARHHRFNFGVG